MRKILFGALALVFSLSLVSAASADKPSDLGFNDAGYNDNANLFNGTGWSWCMDKVGSESWCQNYLGVYANDKLLMKWNNKWSECNANGNDSEEYCAGAWTSNEWNGMFEGGSGSVWHYKFIWVGSELDASPYWRDGGYPIWGSYEVIMDHGIDPSYAPGHIWFAHGIPNGYGN